MESVLRARSMRHRTARCLAAAVGAFLLLALLSTLTASSSAQAVPSRPAAICNPKSATGTGAVTPTTACTSITPGVPMVMGDTGVTLQFDPGASGWVTVTSVPTAPHSPPANGAISLTWHMTTTASAYEVTATFDYGAVAREADIVLLFDDSGSMEFDTLCYGCWEPPDEYHPDGTVHPLRWSQDGPTATPDHCKTGNTYADHGEFTHSDEYYRYKYGDQDYWIVIEAEEYSTDELLADYHLWGHTPYKTFWVIQRNGQGSYGRDAHGGYLSHHPFPNYAGTVGYGVRCTWDALTDPGGPYCRLGLPYGPFPAPRADYDFVAPIAGYYYFWLRGQGGGSTSGDDDIYWGVDSAFPQGAELNYRDGAYYDGASPSRWDWERMGLGSNGDEGDGVWLPAGTHTLSLWAGGAGFDVDRILITTDDTRYDEDGDQYDSDGSDPNLPLKDAPPNNARTGWACERCDPRFAGWDPVRLGLPLSDLLQDDGWWLPHCGAIANPDLRDDPLYAGESPIRPAIEASKRFVAGLDPARDQIGYVTFDTTAHVHSELECLRRRGPANLACPACDPAWSNPGSEPPRDPDCGCFSGVITDTVLYELNRTTSGGSTNIAAAILEGLRVLSPTGGHYGRTDAAQAMILLADGYANRYSTPSGGTSSATSCACIGSPGCCCEKDLWPDGPAADDCVVYYAQVAHDRGIAIHTISLGYGADLELMQAVADLTGGKHMWAPTPSKLDAVFAMLFPPHVLHPPLPDAEAIYSREGPDAPWTMHPLTQTQVDPAARSITGTGITTLSEWTLGPIMPLPPHRITLDASPGTLPANGTSTATLTAVVQDVLDRPVQDGTVVTFTTSLGNVHPATSTTASGVATTTLTAGLQPGQATVTVTAGVVSATTGVEITLPLPERIDLQAVPDALPADGAATACLTAMLVDHLGRIVPQDTPVTFTTSLGSVPPSATVAISGVATTTLTAGFDLGHAVISATGADVSGTIVVPFEPLPPHRIALTATHVFLPADGVASTTLIATVSDIYAHPVKDGTVVTFTTSLGALCVVTGTTSSGVATATLTAGLTSGRATLNATAGGHTATTEVQIGCIFYFPFVGRSDGG